MAETGDGPVRPGTVATATFVPGQRVLVEATIVESFIGDTCVRIVTGDRRSRSSCWVPTDTVKDAAPELDRLVPRHR